MVCVYIGFIALNNCIPYLPKIMNNAVTNALKESGSVVYHENAGFQDKQVLNMEFSDKQETEPSHDSMIVKNYIFNVWLGLVPLIATILLIQVNTKFYQYIFEGNEWIGWVILAVFCPYALFVVFLYIAGCLSNIGYEAVGIIQQKFIIWNYTLLFVQLICTAYNLRCLKSYHN